MSTKDQRLRMAKAIIDFEARRDSKGHFKVYQLPAGDGGGTYEVAGINDRYDPVQAATLAKMVEDGKFADAENYAAEYIATNTDPAALWHKDAGVEFYLRDCVFNRGVHGAARILQLAVGVSDDGDVGPDTQHAMTMWMPAALLDHLREARERYELKVVGRREQFWTGLVNRWDKSLVTAKKFQAETPASASTESWWTVLLNMFLSFFKSPPKPLKDPTPHLTVARSLLGIKENTDEGNAAICKAMAELGGKAGAYFKTGNARSIPWCAGFIGWCLHVAKLKYLDSLWAADYGDYGTKLDGPAVGAIGVMTRNGGGHVTFVVGRDHNGNLMCLGGNQSDMVCIKPFSRSRVGTFTWPSELPLPANVGFDSLPLMTSDGKLSTNEV